MNQDELYDLFISIAGARPTPHNSLIDTGEQIGQSLSDARKPIAVGPPSLAKIITHATLSGPGSLNNSGSTVLQDLQATSPVPNTPGTSNSVESVVSALISTVLGGGALAGTGGVSKSNTESNGMSSLESVASTVLKSGLGVLPIIGGLLGLFGDKESHDQVPMVKYAMPSSLRFEAAELGSGWGGVSYDQRGMPRLDPPVGPWGGGATGDASGEALRTGIGRTEPDVTSAHQITVNIQAMDARSFLDRSGDIAAAVREAMLNLNPINDVVNDL